MDSAIDLLLLVTPAGNLDTRIMNKREMDIANFLNKNLNKTYTLNILKPFQRLTMLVTVFVSFNFWLSPYIDTF